MLTGNNNYKDNSGDVKVIINKANASITVTPYSVTYDGSPHIATGTATGVGGENLAAGLTLSGTTHTNVGAYNGDAWSFSGGTNYNNQSGTVNDLIKAANAPGAAALTLGGSNGLTGGTQSKPLIVTTGAGSATGRPATDPL